MEIFKEFKIENQELIFGGELVATLACCEVCLREDLYDTEMKRMIYFE